MNGKPSEAVVRRVNKHFAPGPLTHREEGDAALLDPWAAFRGYGRVVTFSDGRWEATYGYHKPTHSWHLWAN